VAVALAILQTAKPAALAVVVAGIHLAAAAHQGKEILAGMGSPLELTPATPAVAVAAQEHLGRPGQLVKLAMAA